MQDKLPHIDKKFTDRAWGEMRKMLDREMPANERRRGFFWWWLAAAGLILCVAAWGILKSDDSKPAAPPAVAPTQPIAGKSSAVPGIADSANSQAQAASKIQADRNDFSQTQSPAHPKPFSRNKDRQKPGVPASITEDTPSSHIANLNQLLVSSRKDKTVNIAKAEPENTAIVPAYLPPNAITELAYSSQMPSLLRSGFQQHSPSAMPVEQELPVKKAKENTSGLAFFAGGMAAALSPANGMAVGTSATVQLKKSKLSLEGGLGYAFVQQPLSVQVNQFPTNGGNNPDLLNDELVYAFSRNNKSVDDYNTQTNYSTGVYLHYLQTPVSLRYHLTSKVSVHGGAVAAYLVDLSEGFDGVISLDAGGTDPLVEEDYTGVKIPLSRFDFAATSGMTWQFLPVLGLDFQYRIGVKDLLKSNEVGDYNRLFQLSLRYQLKSKN